MFWEWGWGLWAWALFWVTTRWTKPSLCLHVLPHKKSLVGSWNRLKLLKITGNEENERNPAAESSSNLYVFVLSGFLQKQNNVMGLRFNFLKSFPFPFPHLEGTCLFSIVLITVEMAFTLLHVITEVLHTFLIHPYTELLLKEVGVRTVARSPPN